MPLWFLGLALLLATGCTRKVVKHDGPIIFRDMKCDAAKAECICEVPLLVFDAKTGLDEVLCKPQRPQH
jgi:hypothetical protein